MLDWATGPLIDNFGSVIGAVCVAGVVMAYLSDANTQDGVLSLSSRNAQEKDITSDAKLKIGTHPSIYESFCDLLSETQKSLLRGDILHRFKTKIYSWIELGQVVWAARSLKSAAKSRRQFYYLLEKQLLGISIAKEETEQKSYLDVKRHLGKNWPFMWPVSDVKESQIECDGYKCIPFSSYSYLELMRNTEVQEAAIAAARAYSTGNVGPRMLGGNMRILLELEAAISDFFGRDATLTCATGFLACMSVPCAVASEGDVIFADNRVHASLRSGLKLCGAKVINFKHNDCAHFEKLVKKNRNKYNNAWLVIESVYSMDGDIANLPVLHGISQRHDIKIILDEAHGLGVLGKSGRGLEDHFNMPGVCTIICGTFSKSIATIGGYITGPKDWIEFMDFHAPGNVFSAPLPAYCAGAALKSIELIDREAWRVAKAQENSLYLRHALQTGLGLWPHGYEDKYEVEGDPATTVIPVVFPDDLDRLMRIASLLKKRGFMVAAVAFPACPLRRPRFRITATSAYDRQMIDCFVKELVRATTEEVPSEGSLQLKSLPC